MASAIPKTVSSSTNELEHLILPWASAHHPDKYAKTLAVRGRPEAYRNYLLRLVEIRWAEDRPWRHDAPLRALADTAIVATLRHPGTGMVVEVKGSRAPEPRAWTFLELADMLAAGLDFRTVAAAKAVLDLEHVDPSAPPPSRPVVPVLAPDPAPAPPAPAPTPAPALKRRRGPDPDQASFLPDPRGHRDDS